MNALCAGLVLFGLCVPLPGESRAQVEAADWPIVTESAYSSDWGAHSSMASNKYRLLVSIWGHGKNVVGVLIEERLQASSTSVSKLSRLDRALSEMCRGTAGEKCSHAGVAFNRLPCNGGWMLLASEESTTEARISCKELQRTLEQLPRTHEVGLSSRSDTRGPPAKADAGSK